MAGTKRADELASGPAASRRSGGTGRGDQVRLSSDVALASSALSAAQSSTGIRPAVVERARALLAEGTLGGNAGRLADALIDHALDLHGLSQPDGRRG